MKMYRQRSGNIQQKSKKLMAKTGELQGDQDWGWRLKRNFTLYQKIYSCDVNRCEFFFSKKSINFSFGFGRTLVMLSN